MKKFTTVALAVLLTVSTPMAFAANVPSTPAGPFTISAQVAAALSLTVVLKKNDFNGAVVNSIDFGTLQNTTGTLRSSVTGSTGTGSVVAFLSAAAQGAQYTISQTGGALTGQNTGLQLNTGACVVKSVYSPADNGNVGIPAGASLGQAANGTSWVGTKTLYVSENGPTSRNVTIQASYSITDDPNAGSTGFVPVSQAVDTYTNTVTFTMVTT